jgi:hypothetical protein
MKTAYLAKGFPGNFRTLLVISEEDVFETWLLCAEVSNLEIGDPLEDLVEVRLHLQMDHRPFASHLFDAGQVKSVMRWRLSERDFN